MAPLPFRWSGEAFEPLRGFAKRANNLFVVGEVYRLEPVEDRSSASHKHEFAWLKEAWQNLPETLAEQYPTAEHLRKRALIDAGFYDETIVDAGTQAAAIRVASFVRAREEFTLVIVRGTFVVTRTAKSQSVRAMGNKDFQRSKAAIMDVVSELIGVTSTELARNAGRAA
ncbi:hypothetical protein ABEG18_13205 [Alsobacter sp. KACC 23698]|uniref:Uncharacterized protein n=1 Tax=Alsobacter sp. KACC 23698 TaxID=3149229 RepID=A0AAU7J981_9HYPH